MKRNENEESRSNKKVRITGLLNVLIGTKIRTFFILFFILFN